MSSVSANSSFKAYSEQWRLKRRLRLREQFCNVSHFLSRLHVQLRFGELTRAPLKLLRLQMFEDSVECEWLARAPDLWDSDLPRQVGQRHSSLQTLRDAIDVRSLLFQTFPEAETAYLQVYRDTSNLTREMIVTGCSQRNDHSSRAVHSLAMRAKILGFRFRLEDDILYKLPGGDKPVSAVNYESM
jgi:hypothetical protein